MTLVFFASNNLAVFYITDYITKQYLMNKMKYNKCETQRVFLKSEDGKVSPPTIKDFLCLFGYRNHSTAALFFFGIQHKNWDFLRPGKIYHIPVSPPLNK